MFIYVLPLVIKKKVEITLTGLTPSYVGTCPKTGTGLPTSNVVVVFVFSERRSEEIVCFVDIGESVDHHCKTFFS